MMRIVEQPKGDFFGGTLDHIRFYSNTKNTKLLCFLPGTGELGAGDGLQLDKLYKFGYPKFAAKGTDFPFNMVAIQPVNSYSGVSKALLPWLQMEFKPSSIILIGISLGAIAAIDMLTKDTYSLVKGVVSLSGKASGGPAAAPRMIPLKNYAWHGVNDLTVNYQQAMDFFNAYNKLYNPNAGFEIHTAANTAHCCWDVPMSVDAGNDDLLQWIIKQFGAEPVEQSDLGHATTGELIEELYARAQVGGYANYRPVD